VHESVDLLTLSDTQTASTVTVAPQRGALVTSFSVGGRELLYMDEATLHDTTKNVRGGVPVLFPAPGKLADDHWQRAGRSGCMRQHGFARTQAWQVAQRTASDATLVLTSNDATLGQYPWRFRLQLQLSLRAACLRIAFSVCNNDNTAMPYALGFHPYFRVLDKARVRIPTRATQAFNNVSKRIEPFSGFNLTQPEVDTHLLDHDSATCALYLDETSRIEVRGSEEFALWVIWTLAGKDFICVEPWTAPGNALNSGQGLLVLEPGEARTSWMEISFSGL